MIDDLPPVPWLVPLFTPETPVEVVLSIARAFCTNSPEQSFEPEQETLNLNIAGMLAVELYRRGADEREVPWPLRIEQGHIGDPSSPPPLRRPEAR